MTKLDFSHDIDDTEDHLLWQTCQRGSRMKGQWNNRNLNLAEVQTSIESLKLLREIDKERYRQQNSIYKARVTGKMQQQIDYVKQQEMIKKKKEENA